MYNLIASVVLLIAFALVCLLRPEQTSHQIFVGVLLILHRMDYLDGKNHPENK